MVHRWGLGRRVGDRAAMGAAVALALVVLRTGAALADDPTPSVSTPDGALAAGDSLAGDLPPLDLSLGASGGAVPWAPQPPADPVPRPSASVSAARPFAVDRDVVDLTTCALAALGCAPAESGRLVLDLLPIVIGATSELPAQGQPCVVRAACAIVQPVAAPPGADPAAGQPLPAPGPLTDGTVPALDAVGAALGTTARPGLAAPVSASASGAPAAPAGPDPTGPGLASTGAPVVAALAGLVLLAVGGCLTWARVRA